MTRISNHRGTLQKTQTELKTPFVYPQAYISLRETATLKRHLSSFNAGDVPILAVAAAPLRSHPGFESRPSALKALTEP